MLEGYYAANSANRRDILICFADIPSMAGFAVPERLRIMVLRYVKEVFSEDIKRCCSLPREEIRLQGTLLSIALNKLIVSVQISVHSSAGKVNDSSATFGKYSVRFCPGNRSLPVRIV